MKSSVLFFVFCWCTLGFTQSITSTINKKNIKIGEEIQVILRTKVHASDFVVFPKVDSIGKFEVIENYPVDTLKSNLETVLVKKYGLTQFNAGTFTLPGLEVLFNKKKITTSKQVVLVKDVTVDTTKQKMFDIKADAVIKPEIEQIQIEETTTQQIVLALIGIFLLSFIAYVITKKIQLKVEANQQAYKPPFEKFEHEMKQMEGLEKNSKAFYSKLTEAVKRYFEVTLEIPALESTSNELLLWVSNKISEQQIQLTSSTLLHLERVLQNADLAKFAKIQLEEKMLLADQKSCINTIKEFHQLLPASNEEKRVKKAQEIAEKRRIKQVNIRQLIAISTFVLATLASIFCLGYQNILDYFHQQWEGKDAYYYQKKEWVTSEYGYPPIQLETPEILARIKSDWKSPEIKNFASFQWQNLSDPLSIAVRTIAFKDSVPFVLNDVVNRELGELMQQNAKGIKMDMKKFKNSKGVEGDQVIGTYTFNDEKGSQNHKFCTLILHDNKSQHIITMSYKASDKEAVSWVDRISNSVEWIALEDDE